METQGDCRKRSNHESRNEAASTSTERECEAAAQGVTDFKEGAHQRQEGVNTLPSDSSYPLENQTRAEAAKAGPCDLATAPAGNSAMREGDRTIREGKHHDARGQPDTAPRQAEPDASARRADATSLVPAAAAAAGSGSGAMGVGTTCAPNDANGGRPGSSTLHLQGSACGTSAGSVPTRSRDNIPGSDVSGDLESGKPEAQDAPFAQIPHAFVTMLAAFFGSALFFCVIAAWGAIGSPVQICGRNVQCFSSQVSPSSRSDVLSVGTSGIPESIRAYLDAEVRQVSASALEESRAAARGTADASDARLWERGSFWCSFVWGACLALGGAKLEQRLRGLEKRMFQVDECDPGGAKLEQRLQDVEKWIPEVKLFNRREWALQKLGRLNRYPPAVDIRSGDLDVEGAPKKERQTISVYLEVPAGYADVLKERTVRLWTWGAHSSERDRQRVWPYGERPNCVLQDTRGTTYLRWTYAEGPLSEVKPSAFDSKIEDVGAAGDFVSSPPLTAAVSGGVQVVSPQARGECASPERPTGEEEFYVMRERARHSSFHGILVFSDEVIGISDKTLFDHVCVHTSAAPPHVDVRLTWETLKSADADPIGRPAPAARTPGPIGLSSCGPQDRSADRCAEASHELDRLAEDTARPEQRGGKEVADPERERVNSVEDVAAASALLTGHDEVGHEAQNAAESDGAGPRARGTSFGVLKSLGRLVLERDVSTPQGKVVSTPAEDLRFSVRLEIPPQLHDEAALFSAESWRLWTWGSHSSEHDGNRRWPDGESPELCVEGSERYLRWTYAPRDASDQATSSGAASVSAPRESRESEGVNLMRYDRWFDVRDDAEHEIKSAFSFKVIFYGTCLGGPELVDEVVHGDGDRCFYSGQLPHGWRDGESFKLRWIQGLDDRLRRLQNAHVSQSAQNLCPKPYANAMEPFSVRLEIPPAYEDLITADTLRLWTWGGHTTPHATGTRNGPMEKNRKWWSRTEATTSVGPTCRSKMNRRSAAMTARPSTG